MYRLTRGDVPPYDRVGFTDEAGRVNYVALFETNNHIYTGDIEYVLESLCGVKVSAGSARPSCEIFNTLYSHPKGFAYVGLATANPEALYPYMMSVAETLPGQLSFIGIFPYDGVDGDSCDNLYIQRLGTAGMDGSRVESDMRWVIDIYAEMHGRAEELDTDTWRNIISNCMFGLGIPELGEGIENIVLEIDNALEVEDLELAVETLLDTELRPFAVRVLVYLALKQDLHEYVTADQEV